MIEIKPGVSLRGLSPEIVLAAIIAHGVYQDLRETPKLKPKLTITCCTDGTHGRKSLHYTGYAIDIRTRDLPRDISPVHVALKLRHALGAEFDVVEENDHIHIEYQPKAPIQT